MFIKFEPDSDHSQITHYIQDLSKIITFTPPFIIKTPCNHNGLHFVKKISALEDLLKYEDRIQDVGLILQKYVQFSPLIQSVTNLDIDPIHRT